MEVEPYGTYYVNIVSGLSGGEMLKAQSSAQKSGRLSTQKRGSAGTNRTGGNGRPMGGGMPPF